MIRLLEERDKKLIINKFVNGDYTKDTSIFKGHYLSKDLKKSNLLKEWYDGIQKTKKVQKGN